MLEGDNAFHDFETLLHLHLFICSEHFCIVVYRQIGDYAQ